MGVAPWAPEEDIFIQTGSHQGLGIKTVSGPRPAPTLPDDAGPFYVVSEPQTPQL